jgi:hypothetical protein
MARQLGRWTRWLVAALVALGWGLPAALRTLAPPPYAAVGSDQGAWLGYVAGGQFWPVGRAASGQALDVTEIARQEARSPDSARPDLRPYENRFVTVQGHHSGEWVYEARVVRVAGGAESWLLRYAYGAWR